MTRPDQRPAASALVQRFRSAESLCLRQAVPVSMGLSVQALAVRNYRDARGNERCQVCTVFSFLMCHTLQFVLLTPVLGTFVVHFISSFVSHLQDGACGCSFMPFTYMYLPLLSGCLGLGTAYAWKKSLQLGDLMK